MNDNKVKLQVIKKTCNDGTLEIMCDILLEMIDKMEEKQKIGFVPEDQQ